MSFHNFEHSSLPTFLRKKKRNWARNYMRDFYHFAQFFNKPSFNLAKNLRKKRSKGLKIPEIDHFLVGFSTLPC